MNSSSPKKLQKYVYVALFIPFLSLGFSVSTVDAMDANIDLKELIEAGREENSFKDLTGSVIEGSNNSFKRVQEGSSAPEQPKSEEVTIKKFFSKEVAIKFGVGAIALVTIGSITYVLYKNGTLKEIGKAAQKHPYISAGCVSTLLASIVGVLVYTNTIKLPSLRTS